MERSQESMMKHLRSLCQLDIDAVRAYSQAIEEIDVLEIATKLTEFKTDHERHISDLSALLREFGAPVPEHKTDLKGFFIEKFTAIRSKTGTGGALKAMRGNELLTTRAYSDALEDTSLVERARELVRKNYSDEQRHLHYIEQAIAERVWETRKAG